MRQFYSKALELDNLMSLSSPRRSDLQQLLETIGDDESLAIYFYEKNKNGAWVRLLREAGEFAELGGEDVTRLSQQKARYLSEVADQEPNRVLDIASSIDAKDVVIRNRFLNVVLKNPLEYLKEGTLMIKKYLDGRSDNDWHFVGEPAAKFMVATAEVDTHKAFDVAWLLLEVWKPEKEESFSRDIEARFKPYQYKNLVFKYYRSLWGVDAKRAFGVLIKILKRYVDELQNGKDYEVTSHFYIRLENLDQIERMQRDILAIVVAGTCEAGKALIEKQPAKIDEVLDYVWKLDRAIFKRIVMYLLRFVPAGTANGRINQIIGDRGFLDSPGYKYEYHLLLRDKFEEVNPEALDVFLSWVKEGITGEDMRNFGQWFKKTRGRAHTPDDLKRYENRIRASKLFLVRERFRKLYEECRQKSGATDEELAAKPIVGAGRAIAPTEGSPISSEELVRMQPLEVLGYVRDPSRWAIDKERGSVFHTPEEGLQATFEKVVEQRVDDYANLSPEELIQLKPIFLKRYFHAAWNALREKKSEEKSIVRVLERAKYVIDQHSGSEDYEGVFRSIVYLVEAVFDDEELKGKLVNANCELIWGIIEPLARFEEKDDSTAYDEDPHQGSINCVPGEACTLVVRFALYWKNEDRTHYEENWSDKIISVLKYVVESVRDARVRSVLGVYFPQLHWLEENWTTEHLDSIFDSADDERWDAVWGSYMSWGRPYKKVFELLASRGKYQAAVERIGSSGRYKHDKNPDAGLVEHLMIGFFNGWLEGDEYSLLEVFLEKAGANLRAHAADFLTTGFESLKEEPDEGTSKRLKWYWESRLNEMSKDPAANMAEAVQFVAWVKNSPLGARETFELVEKTLDLTGGKTGQHKGPHDFVEGVCEIADGHELIALTCLNRAMGDEQMVMDFSLYEDELAGLMERVVKLPNDYPDVEKIRAEAIKLADAFGRRHVYKFRWVYEQLSKKVHGAS